MVWMKTSGYSNAVDGWCGVVCVVSVACLRHDTQCVVVVMVDRRKHMIGDVTW